MNKDHLKPDMINQDEDHIAPKLPRSRQRKPNSEHKFFSDRNSYNCESYCAPL